VWQLTVLSRECVCDVTAFILTLPKDINVSSETEINILRCFCWQITSLFYIEINNRNLVSNISDPSCDNMFVSVLVDKNQRYLGWQLLKTSV